MSRRLVVKAVLRSPYGNKAEQYVDPAGHAVRADDTVAFTGSRGLWLVLSVGKPEKLPPGHDYWTVTRVVK